MATRCHITLLGDLRVMQDDREMSRFRTHKAAALLAYLALHLGQAHSREKIVDIFWPEMDIDAGRNNLSTLLSSLRRQLEPPGFAAGSVLIADRLHLQLNPDAVTTDIQDFERLLKQAAGASELPIRAERLGQAAALARGEMLPGYYDDWAIEAQEHWREKITDTMMKHAECLLQCNDWSVAIAATQQIIQRDACREEAYLLQMRAYAALRRAPAALETYRALETALADGLDAPPSAEARRLAERLRDNPDALADPVAPIPEMKPVVAAPPVLTPDAQPLAPDTQHLIPNLPLHLTRFFGRRDELARLEALLTQPNTRLITLLGPGGTGKTRLSIEAAERGADHFGGRVAFVSLAELPVPGLIPTALVHALKLPTTPDAEPMDQVVEALGSRPFLLVLDNFEHLLREPSATHKGDLNGQYSATAYVRLLLQRLPNVTYLATSRQALHLDGEQEFPLRPLETPAADAAPDRLMQCDSIALFVDRARLVRPDFGVTVNNAAAVAAVCRRLEGMPLAVEMAAAWIKTLPPAKILERLERQLDLLTSRRGDLPPRQQSLRAVCEWSHDLLEPELQTFFARLAVFRGGWTLEAAEAVCGRDALDNLALLQEQSLLIAEESGYEPRYRFLETLRSFALEKLVESDAEAATRQAHLDFYLALAEEAEPHFTASDAPQWFDRLEAEHDNLRAAFDWCLETDADTALAAVKTNGALRLVGALWRYWFTRGRLREGVATAERALALWPDALHTPEGIKAMRATGILLNYGGDMSRSQERFLQCLDIAHILGNRQELAAALNNLGAHCNAQGEIARAAEYYREALPILREINHQWGIAATLNNLGVVLTKLQQWEESACVLEESLALKRTQGDTWGIADSLQNLGKMALVRGQLPDSLRYYGEGLRLRLELGQQANIIDSMSGFSHVAFQMREMVVSAQLMGAFTTLRDTLGRILGVQEQAEYEAHLAALREALGASAFEGAFARGGAMTLEQAVACALALSPQNA